MKIIELDKVGSTNEYCKLADDGTDIIVVAKRQSAGKGTKGRNFVSDAGGLYISVMRHYKDYCGADAFKIMVNGCVAVCRTLGYFKIPAVIRWANDVLVNGKKISGTLIENTFSNGNICRSIVGTGINVNNPIAPEIRDTAISMSGFLGKKFNLEEVKEVFINNLSEEYSITDYKDYIDWFGHKIVLVTKEKQMEATALDIAEDGRLVADWRGNILKISSAEVSLRL